MKLSIRLLCAWSCVMGMHIGAAELERSARYHSPSISPLIDTELRELEEDWLSQHAGSDYDSDDESSAAKNALEGFEKDCPLAAVDIREIQKNSDTEGCQKTLNELSLAYTELARHEKYLQDQLYQPRFQAVRAQLDGFKKHLEEMQSQQHVAAASLLPAPLALGTTRAASPDLLSAAVAREDARRASNLNAIERNLREIDTGDVITIRKQITKQGKLTSCNDTLGKIARELSRLDQFESSDDWRVEQLRTKAEQLQKEVQGLRPIIIKSETADARSLQHSGDRKTLAKWAAVGVVASVAIVAAIVCYFKYFKPAAAAQ